MGIEKKRKIGGSGGWRGSRVKCELAVFGLDSKFSALQY